MNLAYKFSVKFSNQLFNFVLVEVFDFTQFFQALSDQVLIVIAIHINNIC